MKAMTTLQLELLSSQGTQTGQHAEIAWLPVDNLFPHPDNPRLIYRQDIIDTIAASIAEGGFKPEYALLVRPLADGYQVISGHTRLKAAQHAGCSVLPCWVKDLDDEAAFMELVLANNQGELSPLEYGMHVLKYVELSEGGRGKKGGLREYARVLGKPFQNIAIYKDAAKVSYQCDTLVVAQLLDKARHLAAIHKAPVDDWQPLTEWLVKAAWSVKLTESIVDAVSDLVCSPEVLDKVLSKFHKQDQNKLVTDTTGLTQATTAAKQLQTQKRQEQVLLGETSLAELRKVDDLTARIKAQLEKVGYPDLIDLWVSYVDSDPVDMKAIQSERVKVENIATARNRGTKQFEETKEYPDLLEAWQDYLTSNPLSVEDIEAKRAELEAIAIEREEKARADKEAEEAAKKPPEPPPLPNLVLADPPWRYDFAATDNRQIENHYPSATVDEIANMKPETQPDCVLFLWATVAKLPQAFEIIDAWGFEYKTSAVWDKEKIGMGYWFRGQHELLLVATKGKFSPPEQQDRVSSVFREPRGEHSKKPECVYRWIEAAFPEAHKLEMFCRSPREGWTVWGNEADA
jgi:N6-adenosine-specific RNA methylase IME4